jgi:hypothetical protein
VADNSDVTLAKFPKEEIDIRHDYYHNVVLIMLGEFGLWFRHGLTVKADALGKHRFVVLCMFVLFAAVQGAVSLEALSVSFSSARYLGSSPSFAVNSDQLGLGDLCGNRNNDIDDSSIELQGLMDSELVAGLACVAHPCNGARS